MTAVDQTLGNYAWKMTFLFVIAVLHSAEVPWLWGGGGAGSPRGTCSASAAMDRNIQRDMSVVLQHFDSRFVSDAA
jgi:hypothetical protein